MLVKEIIFDILEREFIEIGEVGLDYCHIFADKLGVEVIL